MQVISNEMLIPFDVDNTLILPTDNGEDVDINRIKFIDPYDGRMVFRVPHFPHIKLLKNYKARGAFIHVWSKNGNQWAKAAIKALGLEEHVDLVTNKPLFYVDDHPAPAWMGEHVYIDPKDSFGRENAK